MPKKYQNGDVVGPNNMVLVDRQQDDNKRGIFVCQSCGQKFTSDFPAILHGRTTCAHCSRTKYRYGDMVGLDKNIKFLAYASAPASFPVLVRCQCPKCGRTDWIFDRTSINKVHGCNDCYRQERIEALSKKKYKKGDKIGPFCIQFIGYNLEKSDLDKKRYKGNFICPSCKQIFTARIDHIVAGRYVSCPMCKGYSSGEIFIYNFLRSKNIIFETQKTFIDCKSSDKNHALLFDFYLPEYHCCIEYDGRQHFEPIEYFGGEKQFQKQRQHDKIKNEYCKNKHLNLLRICYCIPLKNIPKIINAYLAFMVKERA